MKIITSFALAAVFGLLVSCTISPHPMDMTQAVQSAKTRSDHEALAKHYEDTAKEMQAKAEEQKKVQRGYGAGYDESVPTEHSGLVRSYEQAAAANKRMAEAHRKMAAQAK